MNKSTQLEELDSLKSIFYDEEFQVMEMADGKFQAVFWAFVKLKDNFTVKYLRSLDSPELPTIIIKHLPPIELQLTLPEDYPSNSPPKFIISCQWLHNLKISCLCKRLDEIWSDYGCVEIIYAWCDFLKNDSLTYLGCENELDITGLCENHLMYMQRLQVSEEKKKWRERNTEMIENKPKFKDNGELMEIDKKEGFESPAKLKVIAAKAIKDNHIYYKKCPYIRRNYECRSSRKPGFHQNYNKAQLDERAVLNLSLRMSPIKVLENYNIEREKIEFLRNCYTCNICFCNKLGKDCTRFKDCNHVFCIICIRSYFTEKIKDGNVLSIKCPEDKCTSEALPSQVKEIVSEELFAKYDSVLLNTALDTFSDIIYCPRQMCQYPVSWDPEEKMASCPNCQYVFCVTCKMVYHGIEPCQYKLGEAQKLVEQYEKGSNEVRLQMETRYGKKHLETLVNNSKTESWINDNSKRCPKCDVAIEKSQGCNKMVCWKCNANFCWLCCKVLDTKNPYFHYNDPNSRCADKLFYLVYNSDEEEDEEWDMIDGSGDDFSDFEDDEDFRIFEFM